MTSPTALRLLACLGALLIAACDLDTRPRDAGTGPRVISLSPALTRIVLELGASGQLVGVDRFSHRLPGVDDAVDLGGLFATDLERSVELAPTLVLAVGNREQQSYFDAMRRRGARVETFEGHSLEEILHSYTRVGALLGREVEATRLATRVRTLLDQLEDGRAEVEARVAIVVAVDPLYVVGGGSFVNELITVVGATNVFADLEQPYARVGLEALAERAPDVLIDTTRAAGEDDAARRHWQRHPWVKRVAVLPQGILTLPGPDLAEAAQMLRESLQP